MRIGCMGEVMLELVAGKGTEAQLGIAGDTYNTAVYLARNLPGQVAYLTLLGNDGFSDRIRAHMARYEIATDKVLTHPQRHPGLYAIETDDQGERRFTYWRSESAARCIGDPAFGGFDALLSGLTHFYYSGISLAILAQDRRDQLFNALGHFRADGGQVGFDSNYRPSLWKDQDLAQRETTRAWTSCDIALPSVDDEIVLFGDASTGAVLDRFKGYGVTQGALKRGAEGPVSFEGAELQDLGAPATVVDTTAAGDSFNAGYLSAHLKGADPTACLRAGHELAKQVIGHRGAIIF